MLVFSLLTTGCIKQGVPIYYHTLNSTTASPESMDNLVPDILVGPIHFVSFLEQGQLVTKTSAFTTTLEEQHRWAGDLKEMVSNILLNNLSLTLGSERVFSFPNTHGIGGLQVTINFLHLEKDTDGQAIVVARWKILSNDGRNLLHISTSTYKTEVKANDYDSLVKGLSEGLSWLSMEITNIIKSPTLHVIVTPDSISKPQ